LSPPAPRTTDIVTPEYLTAHGFIKSKCASDIFSLSNVRVGDAARDLGFSLADLRKTPSQPLGSDTRIVKIRNLWFVVDACAKKIPGKPPVPESLDHPDSICTISVALNQIPPEREMMKKGTQPNETSHGTALPRRP
jgi:hypothetical protein